MRIGSVNSQLPTTYGCGGMWPCSLMNCECSYIKENILSYTLPQGEKILACQNPSHSSETSERENYTRGGCVPHPSFYTPMGGKHWGSLFLRNYTTFKNVPYFTLFYLLPPRTINSSSTRRARVSDRRKEGNHKEKNIFNTTKRFHRRIVNYSHMIYINNTLLN